MDEFFAGVNRIADRVVSTASNLADRYLDLQAVRGRVDAARYEADRMAALAQYGAFQPTGAVYRPAGGVTAGGVTAGDVPWGIIAAAAAVGLGAALILRR